MSKKLRVLSLVMAFGLMAAVIPLLRGGGFTAYASSNFTVENGVLTAYTGDDATVTIPSSVTRIKSTAFQTSYSMTKIVIPTSVTTIDNNAFDYCTKLKEFTAAGNPNFCTTDGGVLYTRDLKKILRYPPARTDTSYKIADKVTTIGNSAFYRANNLTSVTVQSGVTSIESWGFCSMKKLTSITLPDTVSSIGNNAFSGDNALTGVTIPGSVTTLGNYTFYNCSALTKITIPDSVKTLGNSVFYGCSGLKTVAMGNSVTTIGESAFSGCSGVEYITIPSTVTKIGKYAFSECTGMKYISINAKAPTIMAGGDILQSCPIKEFTYIGSSSEWNDSGWKYVTSLNASGVGNYLNTNVVEKIFYGFTDSGTSRSIAGFVTGIAKNAFSTNGDMASLGLPASLSSYHKDVFDDCTKLESFSISSSNAKYKVVDGILYSKDGKTLLRYPINKPGTSFTVPSGVTKIGYSAFYKNAKLTNVVLNSPVAVIDEYAFDASHLTAIDIPASVTTVNRYAFASISGTISKVTIRAKDATVNSTAFSGDTITAVNYCDVSSNWNNSVWKTALDGKYSKINYLYLVTNGKLEEYFGYSAGFAVPSGVKEIASGAFRRSPQMNAITISETVTTIPSSTFDALKSLTAINVNANNTTFKSDSGVLYTKDGKAILRYPIAKTGTSYTILSTVTTIGNSAFYWVRNLERVTLPSGLTKVEDYGFDSCPKIKIITIPGKVTTIGYRGFGYMTGLTYLNILAKTPTTVHEEAFTGTTKISKETYIGTSSEFSASKWGSLTNVSGKSKYCNSELQDYTIIKYNDGTATSVSLPEFATYIDNNALPKSLESVYLPKALTSYGTSLFDSLNKLRNIYVQSGCTNFKTSGGVLYSYDGTRLERYPIGNTNASFTVPSTVKTLGHSAFYKCTSLKELTIPSSVTNIESYALSGTLKLNKLVIQDKNPTFDNYPIGSSYFTTVDFRGTMAEWNASSWKSVLSGKYTNLITNSEIVITQQPQSKTINEGETLTLDVKATGNNLTYQWYYKKKGQSSFSVWNNHTHATETVTPNATWDGIQLYCIIKSSDGVSVTSDIATITVKPASFAITKQPTNQYIVLGKPVTVSVQATGNGLTYQWYFKKKGQTSFSVWNGRTKATETCTPNVSWDGIQLYCLVKDSGSNSVKSDTITVSVLSIATQPSNVTVAVGGNATFTVKATGSGLKYQWQYKKKDASGWSDWGSRNTSSTTATANASWDGMQVRCKVTDGAGNYVYSNAATITIGSSTLSITKQPTNQYIVLGKPVTVSVQATGNGLTYQWYFKKKGQTSFSVWNGRTKATETCTPNVSWDGIQLYCLVKDSGSNSVKSNTITVSVLSIATQPSNVTVAVGGNATFTVKATGSGLKYQWQYKKKDASGWSDWGSRNTASTTATANATWDGMQVRCKVTDGAGNYVFSNAATITIK